MSITSSKINIFWCGFLVAQKSKAHGNYSIKIGGKISWQCPFNTYIHTQLEYGSAARLQMRLITKTLDLPNTANHHILRRHADQLTIHNRLLYLAKRWYSKAYDKNAVQHDFVHNHTLYFAGKRWRIPDEILKQWSIFSFLLVPYRNAY